MLVGANVEVMLAPVHIRSGTVRERSAFGSIYLALWGVVRDWCVVYVVVPGGHAAHTCDNDYRGDPWQVLGENAAEAEKLFHGEPETALIAAILWAFEVRVSFALSSFTSRR